ncbi:MAG: class I SAM-dependent methyltransferase [Saprospiraceae bacterium]
MGNLYNQLAAVYEAMYHTFIDYEAEYQFYSKILQEYNKSEVVEIGCGTGNLVPYFLENGFTYLGLDLSENMVKIAKQKFPNGNFIVDDMRFFNLNQPVESIIITARTVSYLLENKDVIATFQSLYNNIKTGGILAFDYIDANSFLPIVDKSEEITHKADYKGKHYVRKSDWKLHLEHNMSFKWNSTYFVKNENQLQELGQDNSILRTFTCNEIELFLTLQGFEIKAFIEKSSYAFPTFVVVAERV